MEKKGNILNQIAIIADLLENVNLESTNTTVIFNLERSEFTRLYNIVNKKSNQIGKMPKNTFNLNVGLVTFIFNTSNV